MKASCIPASIDTRAGLALPAASVRRRQRAASFVSAARFDTRVCKWFCFYGVHISSTRSDRAGSDRGGRRWLVLLLYHVVTSQCLRWQTHALACLGSNTGLTYEASIRTRNYDRQDGKFLNMQPQDRQTTPTNDST